MRLSKKKMSVSKELPGYVEMMVRDVLGQGKRVDITIYDSVIQGEDLRKKIVALAQKVTYRNTEDKVSEDDLVKKVYPYIFVGGFNVAKGI